MKQDSPLRFLIIKESNPLSTLLVVTLKQRVDEIEKMLQINQSGFQVIIIK